MDTLELAEKYINDTNVSLFLTGKAGTGKTTFLRHIITTANKRNVVLAPTGVAAVNAGGVTIHSFFQLPLCPYLPDVKELVTEYQMPDKHKSLRKERINLIRTLELIIIDEISMVRADLLDAVDMSLRKYRRNNKPFGGVQLLLIGDVQQLPPVVTDSERPYIEKVYPSPFFFHSKALQRVKYITIELTHVFRQQDANFIGLLNNIRDNKFDRQTLDALNSRFRQNFDPPDSEGYIRLTTHNYQSDNINHRKLEALPSKAFELKATVDGNFPESSYPTESHLVLKKGAQVMFVKNDSSGGSYFNGKLATVEGYDQDEGIAVVDHNGNHIVVKHERWENIRYEIDPSDNQIKQKVDGSFIQYPLKLAWAITIHKSQGLTFDKLIVDAAGAFTYGQVYVALSRCRSLEGLVLASKLSQNCVFNNAEVLKFNKSFSSKEELAQQLANEQSHYFYELINELFDFSALMIVTEKLNRIYQQHFIRIYPKKSSEMAALYDDNMVNIATVSEKFRRQLTNIQISTRGSMDDERLHDRIAKGAVYFNDQIEHLSKLAIPLLNIEIDNKAIQQEFDEWAETFNDAVGIKLCCIQRISKQGFSTEIYNQAKIDHLLNKKQKDPRDKEKNKKKAVTTSDSNNPELVNLLKHWRLEQAREKDIPAFHILTQKSLMALTELMPVTREELLMTPGIGKVKCQQFGDEIIGIIVNYRREKGL